MRKYAERKRNKNQKKKRKGVKRESSGLGLCPGHMGAVMTVDTLFSPRFGVMAD